MWLGCGKWVVLSDVRICQHTASLQVCKRILLTSDVCYQYRYDLLKARMEELGMPLEPYEAYLDIRKYGSAPHSGFGLGFERLILFATGLDNIRDVIPFPRWPGNANF